MDDHTTYIYIHIFIYTVGRVLLLNYVSWLFLLGHSEFKDYDWGSQKTCKQKYDHNHHHNIRDLC